MMKHRIKTIDYSRCFAIVMVVWGHCIAFGNGDSYYVQNMQTQNFFHNFIYSFHMPLFAILSGYLFYASMEKYTYKELVINKITSLLIPIFAWQFLINVFNFAMCVAGDIIANKSISISDIKILVTPYLRIYNNMWFLWSMLICQLLVIVIRYVFKDKILAHILVMIATLFLKSYRLQLWLWLFPFFSVSYLFAKYKNKISKKLKNSWQLNVCVLLVHILLVIFWKTDIYIYEEYGQGLTLLGRENPIYNLYIDIYRFIAGMFGSLAYIMLIDNFLKRVNVTKRINTLVLTISKYSLGIYVFSTYVLNRILQNYMPFYEYNFVFNILQTVVILTISIITMLIIDKIKILRKFLLWNR